jgi:hypothetical protein
MEIAQFLFIQETRGNSQLIYFNKFSRGNKFILKALPFQKQQTDWIEEKTLKVVN